MLQNWTKLHLARAFFPSSQLTTLPTPEAIYRLINFNWVKKFILMSDRYSSMFNDLVNKLVSSLIDLVVFFHVMLNFTVYMQFIN